MIRRLLAGGSIRVPVFTLNNPRFRSARTGQAAIRLREMEILTAERAELRIQQFERVVARRNDDVLPNLRGVGKNAGKAVEHAFAELDGIQPRSTCGQAFN